MAIGEKRLRLVKYDYAKCRRVFIKNKKTLSRLLSGFDCQVEHFGSTAIKGTVGKGMIDILIVFSTEKEQVSACRILENNGFRRGELDKKPDGRIFLCGNAEQSEAGDIHLHLVIESSSNHLNPLLFRDFLKKHPRYVAEYNQFKKKLAEAAGYKRKKYTRNKQAFIIKITALAKKEARG